MTLGVPILKHFMVGPDQTPHNAASDHGLHCLLMSDYSDASRKWLILLSTMYLSDASLRTRSSGPSCSKHRYLNELFKRSTC